MYYFGVVFFFDYCVFDGVVGFVDEDFLYVVCVLDEVVVVVVLFGDVV